MKNDLISLNVTSKEIDSNRQLLFKHAYCGGKETFNNFIETLSNLAEKEIWSYKDKTSKDILRYYLLDTFEQCSKQNKILESEDNSSQIFNTGLLTENGEGIFGLFNLNNQKDAQKWYFKGFYTETDRAITNIFCDTPKLATYSDDYTDFYFDTSKKVDLSINHILDENWERYDQRLQVLGKEVVKALLVSSFKTTQKKVERNNRLVVPQYYNNKIMYLMPINIPIPNDELITMALAVEKMKTGHYRANTIFTLEMAYSKARLIMKPESNWLINDKNKKEPTNETPLQTPIIKK